MITTLLFDMGNVLIHYDPQHFLDRMGVTDPQDQELLLREISLSPLWPKLDEGEMTEGELEALALPRLPQRLHGYAHQLIFHWDDPIEPVPGMAALLEDCKRAGLKLYLLSNASRRQPEYWGNIPGSALFDGTVVSAFYRCVKPQREIYQVVLEKLASPRRPASSWTTWRRTSPGPRPPASKGWSSPATRTFSAPSSAAWG